MKARDIQIRRLLDAMMYLEDALIEEAAPGEESALIGEKRTRFWKRKGNLRKMTACAAILFVAVVSLWVWKSSFTAKERSALDNGQNAGAASFGAPAECAEEFVPETNTVGVKNKNAADLNAQMPADSADSGMITDKAEIAVLEADKDVATGDVADESKDGTIVRLIEEFPPKFEQGEKGGGSNAVKCYKQPEKGGCVLYNGLQAAIDYWDNANNTIELAEPERYLYHVAIDVFGDVAQNGRMVYEELRLSDAGKELLYQEYERLLISGICVSLSEDFQLTGTLSREELENFEPSADYGYAFRLVNE